MSMSPSCIMLLIGFVLTVPQAPADDAAVKKLAGELANRLTSAVVKGDYEALADLTHPKVVESAGGRERLIKLSREAVEQMKAGGLELIESKAETPGHFVSEGESRFCTVPTRIVLRNGKKRITGRSFLIGCSPDAGKTWSFIEGAAGESSIRGLLPDLPKAVHFPPKEPPKIEPELDSQ